MYSRSFLGLQTAVLLCVLAAPQAFSQKPGDNLCTVDFGDEPLFFMTDMTGDGKDEKVELLLNAAGTTLVARFRLSQDEPYLYMAPDRLIFGSPVGRLPVALVDALRAEGFIPPAPLPHLRKLEDKAYLGRIDLPYQSTMWNLETPVGSSANVDPTKHKLASTAPALAVYSTLLRQRTKGASWALENNKVVSEEVSLDFIVHVPERLFSEEAPPDPTPTSGPSSCPSTADWSICRIGAASAWNGSSPVTGKGVRVAVIDTAIDKHELLEGRVLWNQAFSINQTEPTDGHGTAVAGIIGANKGPEGRPGVAPEVSLIPVHVLENRCGRISDVIDGIDHAIKKKAQVIAAPWVLGHDNKELKTAIARANHILFVTPADGQRVNMEQMRVYPAAWKDDLENLMVVGGVNKKDQWVYAYGKDTVHLAAPATKLYLPSLDNTKQTLSGTSFAVGLVAGAAALILQDAPGATPREIRDKLLDGARLKGSFTNCCRSGCGILDVAKVFGHPPAPHPSSSHPNACPD